MNKDQFLGYLEVYGAELKRWPEDKRALASSFFQSKDEEILARIQEEADFDAILVSSDKQSPISVSLEAHLIELVPKANASRPSFLSRIRSLSAPKWASAGLISAALVGGLGVGYAQAAEQAELNAVSDMLAYASIEDLSELDTSTWLQSDEVGND